LGVVEQFYEVNVFWSEEKKMRQRLRDLSRRDLLKLFGITMGATIADQIAMPKKIKAAQGAKITPRKTARHVIVIQNGGAPSPWEVFDFKNQVDGEGSEH
jgi:hypothetical protein